METQTTFFFFCLDYVSEHSRSDSLWGLRSFSLDSGKILESMTRTAVSECQSASTGSSETRADGVKGGTNCIPIILNGQHHSLVHFSINTVRLFWQWSPQKLEIGFCHQGHWNLSDTSPRLQTTSPRSLFHRLTESFRLLSNMWKVQPSISFTTLALF